MKQLKIFHHELGRFFKFRRNLRVFGKYIKVPEEREKLSEAILKSKKTEMNILTLLVLGSAVIGTHAEGYGRTGFRKQDENGVQSSFNENFRRQTVLNNGYRQSLINQNDFRNQNNDFNNIGNQFTSPRENGRQSFSEFQFRTSQPVTPITLTVYDGQSRFNRGNDNGQVGSNRNYINQYDSNELNGQNGYGGQSRFNGGFGTFEPESSGNNIDMFNSVRSNGMSRFGSQSHSYGGYGFQSGMNGGNGMNNGNQNNSTGQTSSNITTETTVITTKRPKSQSMEINNDESGRQSVSNTTNSDQTRSSRVGNRDQNGSDIDQSRTTNRNNSSQSVSNGKSVSQSRGINNFKNSYRYNKRNYGRFRYGGGNRNRFGLNGDSSGQSNSKNGDGNQSGSNESMNKGLSGSNGGRDQSNSDNGNGMQLGSNNSTENPSGSNNGDGMPGSNQSNNSTRDQLRSYGGYGRQNGFGNADRQLLGFRNRGQFGRNRRLNNRFRSNRQTIGQLLPNDLTGDIGVDQGQGSVLSTNGRVGRQFYLNNINGDQSGLFNRFGGQFGQTDDNIYQPILNGGLGTRNRFGSNGDSSGQSNSKNGDGNQSGSNESKNKGLSGSNNGGRDQSNSDNGNGVQLGSNNSTENSSGSYNSDGMLGSNQSNNNIGDQPRSYRGYGRQNDLGNAYRRLAGSRNRGQFGRNRRLNNRFRSNRQTIGQLLPNDLTGDTVVDQGQGSVLSTNGRVGRQFHLNNINGDQSGLFNRFGGQFGQTDDNIYQPVLNGGLGTRNRFGSNGDSSVQSNSKNGDGNQSASNESMNKGLSGSNNDSRDQSNSDNGNGMQLGSNNSTENTSGSNNGDGILGSNQSNNSTGDQPRSYRGYGRQNGYGNAYRRLPGSRNRGQFSRNRRLNNRFRSNRQTIGKLLPNDLTGDTVVDQGQGSILSTNGRVGRQFNLNNINGDQFGLFNRFGGQFGQTDDNIHQPVLNVGLGTRNVLDSFSNGNLDGVNLDKVNIDGRGQKLQDSDRVTQSESNRQSGTSDRNKESSINGNNDDFNNQKSQSQYKFGYEIEIPEDELLSSAYWRLQQDPRKFQFDQQQTHPYGSRSNMYYLAENDQQMDTPLA